MASTSQKINFGVADNKVGLLQALGNIHNIPKRLPVSVVDIDKTNSIMTLKFETDGLPFTLPNITVPLSGPEYIRYPIKKQSQEQGQTKPGDFGFVTSADTNIGNMSGLGPKTPANFTLPTNLSPLIFTLMGNKNWSKTEDQDATLAYGRTGTINRDDQKKTKHIVHRDNGITSQTGAQGQTGPESDPTYNIQHFLHPKDGLLAKMTDQDNGDHLLSLIPKGGSGVIGAVLSAFGGKHKHTITDAGHELTSDKKVDVTAPTTNIKSQQTNIQGNTSVQGVLSALGGITGGGGGGGGGGAGGGSGGINAQGGITGASVSVTGNSASDTLSTNGYTVAALNTAFPPADNAGMRAYVTDSTGQAFRITLIGGGAVVCPAFCNGVSWIAG